MSGEILQINHIGPTLSRRCERRHAKRVNGHGRVKLKSRDVPPNKVLDAANGERLRLKPILAVAARAADGTKEGTMTVFVKLGDVDPRLESLHGLDVERHVSFLASFAKKTEDAVFAIDFEVRNFKAT